LNSTSNILADEMLSHQINLFRFAAGERSKILAVFMQMQKELKAKLQTDLTDFGRARVTKLLKECTATIDGYYKGMNNSLDLEGLAKNEAKAAVSAINGVGLDAAIPSKATLSAMVSDTLLSGAPLKDWWAKQSKNMAFNFAAQVRQGMIQGEGLQDIINRIVGNVKKGIPGIMDISRRHASTLVHDSVMQVANDAKLAVYRENADILKGVEQLSTLDSKTSETCIAYSGAAWDLDGNPINGTKLPFNGGCPRHPNCRSVLVPITKTYRELGLDVNEKGAGTRSSDLGQVKADMTFDAFLKRHSTEYQDALLGKGKAQLWRDGKITLTDLLGQNGRPLTLLQLAGTIAPVAKAAITTAVVEKEAFSIHEDALKYVMEIGKTRKVEAAFVYDNATQQMLIQKVGKKHSVAFRRSEVDLMRGKTVVHNHPTFPENSLSQPDLHLAAKAKLHEVVAVSPNGTQYVATVKDYVAPDVYRRVNAYVKAEIQSAINKHEITLKDAQQIHYHIVNVALSKAGHFDYSVRTESGVFNALMSKHKELMDKILAGVK